VNVERSTTPLAAVVSPAAVAPTAATPVQPPVILRTWASLGSGSAADPCDLKTRPREAAELDAKLFGARQSSVVNQLESAGADVVEIEALAGRFARGDLQKTEAAPAPRGLKPHEELAAPLADVSTRLREARTFIFATRTPI
jgi:hypothetical protein